MDYLQPDDPRALAVSDAIRSGNTAELEDLLLENPGLVAARIKDGNMSRTLLHIATDWPGHFPNVADTIRLLIKSGAEVDARFEGPHTETPLHWAASSDDVAALNALVEAGADINATGACIAGGTPLTDARAFAQWNAARRLVELGADVSLIDAAALGMQNLVEDYLTAADQLSAFELNLALWSAAGQGYVEIAVLLHQSGADLNWIPEWEHVTSLDVAERSGHGAMSSWLRDKGGKSALQLS